MTWQAAKTSNNKAQKKFVNNNCLNNNKFPAYIVNAKYKTGPHLLLARSQGKQQVRFKSIIMLLQNCKPTRSCKKNQQRERELENRDEGTQRWSVCCLCFCCAFFLLTTQILFIYFWLLLLWPNKQQQFLYVCFISCLVRQSDGYWVLSLLIFWSRVREKEREREREREITEGWCRVHLVPHFEECFFSKLPYLLTTDVWY